jgi:hypothetical protein
MCYDSKCARRAATNGRKAWSDTSNEEASNMSNVTRGPHAPLAIDPSKTLLRALKRLDQETLAILTGWSAATGRTVDDLLAEVITDRREKRLARERKSLARRRAPHKPRVGLPVEALGYVEGMSADDACSEIASAIPSPESAVRLIA